MLISETNPILHCRVLNRNNIPNNNQQNNGTPPPPPAGKLSLSNIVQPQPNVPNQRVIRAWKLAKGPAPKQVIPLKLFQTYHTLNVPPHMKQNIERLKAQNPEFTYMLFDDKMCRDFIKAHFANDVVNAFDALKPGAYKADLWRYCVLYIYGGIYMDIKFNCVNNFKLVDLLDKEYYVKDRYHRGRYGIYQAVMVNVAKNPILWECIQQIVRNVRAKYYGDNPLCITGPHLLCKYFKQEDISKMELYNGPEGDCVYIRGYKIIDIYPNYRKEQRATQNTQYYNKMWHAKDVYA